MIVKLMELIKTMYEQEPFIMLMAVIALLAYIVALIYQYFAEKEIRENLRQAFDDTTKGLFSEKLSERICSAILLRRFLNKKNKEGRGKNSYRMEAVNVIASLLKIEKCGVLQKTLADSLSYIENIDEFDFQNCNFQNMCLIPNKVVLAKELGFFRRCIYRIRKKHNIQEEIKVSMCGTDFFMADFSYSTISFIEAQKAVFFKANMYKSTIKHSNLTNANFYESYSSGIKFVNCVFTFASFGNAFANNATFSQCILNDVDFTGAYIDDATFENCHLKNVNFSGTSLKNIRFIYQEKSSKNLVEKVNFIDAKHLPDLIANNLKGGIFTGKIEPEQPTQKTQGISDKRIFLSCSGALSPKQGEFASKLKHDLSLFGIEIVNFDRTKYRLTVQVSSILTEMASCHGVVSLCFKDIEIKEGIYRPQTEDMTVINDKIMTSPWINIEMGLAVGIRKPMLILYDGRINDGLIDTDITDISISKINFNSLNYADYEYEIRQWALNLDSKNVV